MKIWAKFNAGFQLCPVILILSPRSREAGDAPVPRTLNRTVGLPAYRTSVQFLKRTVPVPLQKKAYRTSVTVCILCQRTVLFSKN